MYRDSPNRGVGPETEFRGTMYRGISPETEFQNTLPYLRITFCTNCSLVVRFLMRK